MAKKTAATALAVVEAPRETLHQIETELRGLCEFRDSLADTEVEAIKVTDEQIQAFVGREIRKVTSIASLLRYFRSQTEAAAVEERHARKWRERWEARYNRLATMVHGVMVALDVQKLEGATDRFRRQNNPEALDPFDVGKIPDEYLKVRLTMPLSEFKLMVGALPEDGARRLISFKVGDNEVDAVKLKAALQTPAECGACHGIGEAASADGKGVLVCEKCQGAGTVPATIPGAKLTRGEHLRVE